MLLIDGKQGHPSTVVSVIPDVGVVDYVQDSMVHFMILEWPHVGWVGADVEPQFIDLFGKGSVFE